MSMLPQGTTRWLILALVGILNFGLLAPSLALAQVDHAIGSTATVTNSGDAPVLLRVTPNYDAEVLTVLPEGATVTVLNKPESAADGSIWIQVEADDESGYVVADFLLADTDESAVATEEATVSTELEPVPQTEPAEPVEPVEQAEQSERTEPTTEADPLVAVASTGGSGTATTTSNLNLRSGPSLNYAVITVIPADCTVSVDGDPQVGFYPVTYNGTGGWAQGDYLRFDSDNGNSGRTETGSGTAQVRVNLNLRAGPSTADAVITVMPANATVTLTGQSANGFLSVSFNGRAGWAYADYLDTSGGSTPPPSSKPDGRTAMTTANLNMRSGPSLSNSVILVISTGSTVETTGNAQSGFYPVNYAGRSGWAHGDYLNFGSGSGNNPSPPPGGSGSGIISHKASTARATTTWRRTLSVLLLVRSGAG